MSICPYNIELERALAGTYDCPVSLELDNCREERDELCAGIERAVGEIKEASEGDYDEDDAEGYKAGLRAAVEIIRAETGITAETKGE